MVETANTIWADGPLGNPTQPDKALIRAWGTMLEEAAASTREKLTGNRTYYVRPDGSDSNTGLVNSAGGAFLTIQKAINVVQDTLDPTPGLTVTIQSGAAGTYTAPNTINGGLMGGASLVILGDMTNPDNHQVSVSSGDCFLVQNGAAVAIRGFKLSNSGSGAGISAQLSANVSATNVNFGVCGGSHYNCGTGANIDIGGNYTISGSALSHWHCGAFGRIGINALTLTLTGTPAFGAYFCGVAQGAVYVSGVTFSGAATGTKFVAHYGGVIVANGGTDESYLPGSVPGNTAAFGMYQCIVVGGANLGGWTLSPEIYPNNYLSMLSKNFNANTWNTHIKMQNDLFQGKGYFYMNGDDSYSSGRTHFAGDATVNVAAGVVDGWTYYPKASGNPLFMASNNSLPVGYMRRRTSDGPVLGFNRDTTSVGSITVTTTNTAYNTSSDRRLKQNFGAAEYDPGWISQAAKMVCSFEFKADPAKRHVGVVAQDFIKVAPEAVTRGNKKKPGSEGFDAWGVDPSKLIWKLLMEVAELRRRLDGLNRQDVTG
ncbi:tail fiber domain-containing protein [Mesorhizobium sp.]|uniref:tail fiber domain-containing protein n=1 Tax=Mesorhizobium sp. TaxID=1871066 RepID=UPI000FE910A3|nr:tail fiber domain-containing protein [Mesorhizobium sp.]RWC28804.1 MAG: tail fiber domain-containing protein [Mesorhizobium sp.]TIX28285.1 MAG: tail fiber domain-containing protein [Mesorhizobium sp.]